MKNTNCGKAQMEQGTTAVKSTPLLEVTMIINLVQTSSSNQQTEWKKKKNDQLAVLTMMQRYSNLPAKLFRFDKGTAPPDLVLPTHKTRMYARMVTVGRLAPKGSLGSGCYSNELRPWTCIAP